MIEKTIHTFAILAYEESPYLEQCILSLKSQTVESQIYIATSTPSVSLTDIADKYQIPIYVNNNSEGIADDWSFAYNKCATQYITLAHQDDIYLPKYTQTCLDAAKLYKRNLIVFTSSQHMVKEKIRRIDVNSFIKNILLMPFVFKKNISSAFLRKFILLFGSPIQCPTVMYHKEYIGNFEFSKDFQCNMDWDAWLRLSKRCGSFIYLRRNLVIHRIHKDSQTTMQIKNRIREKEEKMIFERFWPRPLAQLLSVMYSIAVKSNKID